MREDYYNNTCLSYPWWLIAGTGLSGKVLVIGNIHESELCLMRIISPALTCMTPHEFSNLDNDNRYDVIFLVTGQALDRNVLSALSRTLMNSLTPAGVLIIYGIKAGCEDVSSYNLILPCIVYNNYPAEAYVQGQYTSNKNQCLLKEKAKTIILNTSLHKLFITNYLQIYSRSETPVNLINDLNSSLQSIASIKQYVNTSKLSKIYIKYGKLIFIYKSSYPGSNYVVVIPVDKVALKQRENEKYTIDSLRNNAELKKYIVSYYIESEVAGFRSCIMEDVAGNTVDTSCKGMHTMVRNAYLAIIALAKHTKNNNFTDEILRIKLRNYINDFNIKMTRYGLALNITPEFLIDNLKGIPSVCMHGDLKLENFVLNADNSVKNIIDWELSDLQGFPLLDLYYFITYNNRIIYKTDLNKSIFMLYNYRNETRYSDMINDYASIINLNKKQIASLFAVFFIHHFSYRIEIDYMDSAEQTELQDFFNTVIADIAGSH